MALLTLPNGEISRRASRTLGYFRRVDGASFRSDSPIVTFNWICFIDKPLLGALTTYAERERYDTD
ncbi:hypothetical protein ABH944_003295 [Caballeronia udeis]|uniref:Uncharacterized protein n=1 Tax=Caballeronia udeis TaxID=1232866 RepID=A0ABW8MHD2_9BURK